VIASVAVIGVGIAFSAFRHHLPMERMRTAGFDYHPRLIWRQILELRGQAIIELGLYLLLATPIARVAASIGVFLIAEGDRFYAIVTALVLVLTLAGLLLLRCAERRTSIVEVSIRRTAAGAVNAAALDLGKRAVDVFDGGVELAVDRGDLVVGTKPDAAGVINADDLAWRQ
jgi:uncharacterized membrane protein